MIKEWFSEETENKHNNDCAGNLTVSVSGRDVRTHFSISSSNVNLP